MNGEQSRLLGDIHIALLKLLQADMEEAYATGAIQVRSLCCRCLSQFVQVVSAYLRTSAHFTESALVGSTSRGACMHMLLHITAAASYEHCFCSVTVCSMCVTTCPGCFRVVELQTSWIAPSSTVPTIWRKLWPGALTSMSGGLI